MAKIIDFDKHGHIVYQGLLTNEEVKSYQVVINALKEEFPEIERELKERYPNKTGTGWEYKYYLGKALGEYLNRFEVTEDERRRFYDEIKNLASEDTRKRDEGKKSKTRSFFEQCYLFSRIDEKAVQNLGWGEWQSLFDRTASREDMRIIDWIGKQKEKISRKDWRAFMKALHIYVKKIDTAVFSDDELFEIYDSILEMSKYWVNEFKSYSIDHPKSMKIKKEQAWSKKYFEKCYSLKKESGLDIITKDNCKQAFDEVMK